MAKRAKRPKRKRDQDVVPPELLELTAADAAKGISPRVIDRSPWLDDHGADAPWYDALEKLDETGDKAPLIALLKSDKELTPAIRGHIANLLNRYTLEPRRGGQATPSYVLSDVNARLWLLVDAMHSEGEMSVEQAAEKYATKEFPTETLINVYHGRDGNFARAMRKKK